MMQNHPGSPLEWEVINLVSSQQHTFIKQSVHKINAASSNYTMGVFMCQYEWEYLNTIFYLFFFSQESLKDNWSLPQQLN